MKSEQKHLFALGGREDRLGCRNQGLRAFCVERAEAVGAQELRLRAGPVTPSRGLNTAGAELRACAAATASPSLVWSLPSPSSSSSFSSSKLIWCTVPSSQAQPTPTSCLVSRCPAVSYQRLPLYPAVPLSGCFSRGPRLASSDLGSQ